MELNTPAVGWKLNTLMDALKDGLKPGVFF